MLKVCGKIELFQNNCVIKFLLYIILSGFERTFFFISKYIFVWSIWEINLPYANSPDIIYFVFIWILLINNLKKLLSITLELSWALCALLRTIFISFQEKHNFFETLEYVSNQSNQPNNKNDKDNHVATTIHGLYVRAETTQKKCLNEQSCHLLHNLSLRIRTCLSNILQFLNFIN